MDPTINLAHFIIEKFIQNPMAIVDERKLQTPGYDYDKGQYVTIMKFVSRMTLDDINYKDITDVASMSLI